MGFLSALKRALRWLVPRSEKSADGRERWPSRTAFILASMGGAVGLGNLLRYPTVVYKHNGLQWFIPYLIALFFIGIPVLMMEVCFGQAYRGGAVVSFGRVSKRLRGVGLATTLLGFMIATYYAVIMSWVMTYFRNSFISPLPWAENNEKFFTNNVIRNKEALKDLNGFKSYPGRAVIGETLGWTMMTWVFVYLCIFKGVGLTGRVVYVTMLLPLILIVVITIRSVTLKNARRGILWYVGEWHSEKLRKSDIWIDAITQVFFSISAGFGYYTAYASYNSEFANAVQDSLIVALSNSVIEVLAAFSAFGVLGYLYDNRTRLKKVSSFTLGFQTYPTALAELRGSNVWAVFFFLMLYFLGIDSAFALLEGFVTVVWDTDWGKRPPRPVLVGVITVAAALLSIMYTTEFGLSLLGAVDKWLTEIPLVLSTWLQCTIVTSVYRYKDVVGQTGKVAYLIAQGSYFSSMILGVILGQTVGAAAGGGVAAGVLVLGTVAATVLSKKPEVDGPWPWNCFKYTNAFFWLTSYSGHQLSQDLNAVVGRGKNWGLPLLWAPVLRWVSAPILMWFLSESYRQFKGHIKDPLHIFGFAAAHFVVFVALVGIILPISMNIMVSQAEKRSYKKQYESEPRKILEVPDDEEEQKEDGSSNENQRNEADLESARSS